MTSRGQYTHDVKRQGSAARLAVLDSEATARTDFEVLYSLEMARGTVYLPNVAIQQASCLAKPTARVTSCHLF